MNPGIIEETGQTARSFIEALKTQPATLAMIVANVVMLVFLFYALERGAKFRDDLLKSQFEYQREMSVLLSKCVVPN